jgi:hypothetical protein
MKRRLRAGARLAASLVARIGGNEDDLSRDEEAARSPFVYDSLNLLHERIMARGGSSLRANYLYGVLHAARLASVLGIRSISALEFGVAGGSGLIALEKASVFVEEAFDVSIEVYGFDSGRGLPRPRDHRDCPNLFREGQFPVDEAKLRAKLERASLVVGLVDETVPAFLTENPSPIGFVSFDLDLYSSTVAALGIFEADASLLLPRVHCYFDDVTGFTYGEHNGELLAIAEFNDSHPTCKISRVQAAEFYVPRAESRALWVRKLYMAHVLNHPRYADYDGLINPEAAAAGGAWSID